MTGVQTCALPICGVFPYPLGKIRHAKMTAHGSDKIRPVNGVGEGGTSAHACAHDLDAGVVDGMSGQHLLHHGVEELLGAGVHPVRRSKLRHEDMIAVGCQEPSDPIVRRSLQVVVLVRAAGAGAFREALVTLISPQHGEASPGRDADVTDPFAALVALKRDRGSDTQ